MFWISELLFFSPNRNNILRSWFVEGSNILNYLIIPRNQPNVTWFSYIYCCIRLLLDHCLVILDWPLNSYTHDYYYFVYIKPWYTLLLSIWVDLMVRCDCVEVTGAGGRNSEGVLTMALLLSTLLLFCKGFPWTFLLRGKIQPRYWKSRSSLPWYLLYGLFTPLPVLQFVCSWVGTLRPSGE